MAVRPKEDVTLEGGTITVKRGFILGNEVIPLVNVESVEVVEGDEGNVLRLGVAESDPLEIGPLSEEEAEEMRDLYSVSVDPPESRADEKLDLEEIGDRIEKMCERPGIRMSKVTEFVIDQAMRHRASDIHIDGTEEGYEVNFRIDGTVHRVGEASGNAGEQLLQYMKVNSSLKLFRSDVPQEGGGHLEKENDGKLDVRLSSVPTMNREKAVLRVFDLPEDSLDIRELGFADETVETLERLLEKGQGLMLLAGPSSSGKTTTLYSALRELIRKPEMAEQVVSIEDPIERLVSGISQIEVDPDKEMTFPKLFRHVLRQDARAIMLGEIRDDDTSKVAMESSLTGHLIISTIHAGRAPEVIVRLLDMGNKPYQVASALSGSMAQRLLRKVCPHCKVEHQPDEDAIKRFDEYFDGSEKFVTGEGCPECYNTGFLGRTAVAEIIEIGPDWDEIIAGLPTVNQLQETALERGMVTMEEHAAKKAAEGITTLEEVKRLFP